MHRRVFVTGVGVVSGLGAGVDAFWRGLTTGATGLSRAPAPLAAVGAKVIGAVRDFSGAAYLQNERHARVLNRTFELLVGAGALAAADGALAATPVPPPRLAVVVGMGSIDQYTSDLLDAARQATTEAGLDVARFAETARGMYPLRRLRLLPNVGPALLSIEHKAMGPSLTLVSGHAAGLQAIAQAFTLIREGRADAALCGGADSHLTPLGLQQFGLLRPISPSADPDSACRPFDRARDGVTPGEGAAIMLLEAEDSARARGVTSYAELVSCAFAGPTEGGCAESMRQAMLGFPGRTPEVVVAHGDGGVQSDRLEAAAMDLVSPRCITSLQAVVGHTMSACGALNTAAACLILADERVPPIRSLQAPEVALPFAMHQIAARFGSVLVNAIEPDNAAASALLVRV
ncbi:MAG: beta-ketoacyl-[acyl-carrier-protein] synthase family protein [Betaproteobacteria bacterium]